MIIASIHNNGVVNETSRRKLVSMRSIALAVAAISAALIAGCGSGDSTAEFERIRDTGTIISPQTLAAAGFKESKTYSVDDLPGASTAMFGFWRASGRDPLDFEVRFYPSHDDAVRLGTAPAKEGSGDDAVLDAESATFKEGVQDRRTIIGTGTGGGARSGIGPKYADFVIFNNVVILCPGGQVEQSHERCADLIDALENR